jgi:hypothetical protein
MEINDEILEILSELKIQKDNGICYLLSLFYGYKPEFIPDTFKQRMNITGIYEEERGSIKWNVPLFEGQQTAFEWVKDYCQLFKDANPARTGHVREATTLLKKLFATNPEIRKDDIIGATKMYIRNTDPKYIMMPHYFIQKGIGASKTTTIIDWIEKFKIADEQEKGRESITNTMQ